MKERKSINRYSLADALLLCLFAFTSSITQLLLINQTFSSIQLFILEELLELL